jgi:hypothetical protein
MAFVADAQAVVRCTVPCGSPWELSHAAFWNRGGDGSIPLPSVDDLDRRVLPSSATQKTTTVYDRVGFVIEKMAHFGYVSGVTFDVLVTVVNTVFGKRHTAGYIASQLRSAAAPEQTLWRMSSGEKVVWPAIFGTVPSERLSVGQVTYLLNCHVAETNTEACDTTGTEACDTTGTEACDTTGTEACDTTGTEACDTTGLRPAGSSSPDGDGGENGEDGDTSPGTESGKEEAFAADGALLRPDRIGFVRSLLDGQPQKNFTLSDVQEAWLTQSTLPSIAQRTRILPIQPAELENPLRLDCLWRRVRGGAASAAAVFCSMHSEQELNGDMRATKRPKTQTSDEALSLSALWESAGYDMCDGFQHTTLAKTEQNLLRQFSA